MDFCCAIKAIRRARQSFKELRDRGRLLYARRGRCGQQCVLNPHQTRPTQNLTQQNPNQVDAFAVLSEAVTLYEAERLVEIDTRAARGGS